MRAVDIYNSLGQAVAKYPNLPVVVRGLDDSGNEVDIKLQGVVTIGSEHWGPVIVLK